MSPVEEKRRFIRHEFQTKVRLFPIRLSPSGHILELQENSVEAWADDISTGGLKLEGFHFYGPDTLLKLNLEIEGEQPVEAYGKVIWAFDHHTGIRFILKDANLSHRIKAIGRKSNSAIHSSSS